MNRKAKPVEMVDCATNKLMRVYASGSDAAEHMGLYQSGMSVYIYTTNHPCNPVTTNLYYTCISFFVRLHVAYLIIAYNPISTCVYIYIHIYSHIVVCERIEAVVCRL